ncbi:uncharacterized protein LOC135813837 [Sycon ciliatum]|uniref:uncharacterized protein LOC135813837 n=1 Tax=Sycon ciliatum TaxID=27933 RepID=UPI0031F65B98|eukprot:scpid27043/ scgid30718/ 39S ribosomal protein L49, mitochondrial
MMLASCCTALRPTLAPRSVFARTYVARQAKDRMRWWLDFDPHKHGEKMFEQYSKKEAKRVESLQERVKRFRAMRGRTDDLDALEELAKEEEKEPLRPKNWQPPPAELPKDLGYVVKRTRFGQLPVYTRYLNMREVCKINIRRVDGDLWILKAELKKDLGIDLIQVNELTGQLNVFPLWEKKFEVKQAIEEFLYRKGF